MKSGFINIIGNPNVGKSTLMNSLVGENLSITSYKAQTTRHRIMGIVNSEDCQMVFSDTPGIVNVANKLHQQMLSYINTSLQDADIFLLVIEVGQQFRSESILEKIAKSHIPTIIVINKIDLCSQQIVQQSIDYWQAIMPKAKIIPASALHKYNIDTIFVALKNLLPEHERYYDKDTLTDKSVRFFVSEIIREKILLLYSKEIPYSTQVVVEQYKEEEIDKILATIYVERESQKNIIIGKNGLMIKKVGILSRKDIEEFVGKKVFLQLFVKVKENWRNNIKDLKHFGYNND